MSWDHVTVGFERFDAFVHAIKILGLPVLEVPKEGLKQIGQPSVITSELSHACHCDMVPSDFHYEGEPCPHCSGECDCIHYLRLALFSTCTGQPMVVEEWLCQHDCDYEGLDIVDIAVYPEGARPSLVTEVIEAR